MERLTYRDYDGRARLTKYGMRAYCSTQATADCFAKLEESIPRWISVKERVPNEDEIVLVFGGRSIYTAVYGWRCGWYGWHKLNSARRSIEPTHWMPLPEPPKEGCDEDD